MLEVNTTNFTPGNTVHKATAYQQDLYDTQVDVYFIDYEAFTIMVYGTVKGMRVDVEAIVDANDGDDNNMNVDQQPVTGPNRLMALPIEPTK